MNLKPKLASHIILIITGVAVHIIAITAMAQTFTTLHSFGTISGNSPEAPLVLGPDGRLYGTTFNGGAYSSGTVFAIDTNGTGFTVLHSFTGTNDGANPRAGLTLSGNTFFGTTSRGGTNFSGTVFAINVDRTGFTVLHTFSTNDVSTHFTNYDGANPYATLTLSGNTLYGTTANGGIYSGGTVFALNTNGGGFVSLHAFGGDLDQTTLTHSNGVSPNAGLILSGDTLYGTTFGGGTNASGTVFEIKTDGAAFATLHTFTGGEDGAYPIAALTLLGNTLYGTASEGTTNSQGTVFAVQTDGSSFRTLHTFSSLQSANIAGANPRAGLVISGNTLYGTTFAGSAAYPTSNGTVFALKTDGSGFAILYNFAGGSNGSEPQAALLLSGNTLYGTTGAYGGISDDYGMIFAISTNGTAFTNLYAFVRFSSGYSSYVNTDGMNPISSVILSSNVLYGTSSAGGAFDQGTLFSVNTDGANFNTLLNFDAVTTGSHPAGLILSGNTFYGVTAIGGTNANGVIFKVNTDGSGFAAVYTFAKESYSSSFFTQTNADGSSPNSLILSGDTLYGSTSGGGPEGSGTIFSVKTNGTGFTLLHSFESFIFIGNDGDSPNPGLILSSNTLYGTTKSGGATEFGTVFAINTDGTQFRTLYNFSGISSSYGDTNSDGANPYAGLALSGSTLYGTTSTGGANASGTIYKVNTDSTGFSVLHTFSAPGGSPQGNLTLAGNTIYGTASKGGAYSQGAVFSLNTNGTTFTTVHDFTARNGDYSTYVVTNSDGAFPVANVIISNSILYSTTEFGGQFGGGTVFSLSLPPTTNYPASYQTMLVTPAPFSQAMGISGGNIVGCYFYDNSDDTGFLYNGAAYTSLTDTNAVGFSGAIGVNGPDGYLFGGTFPAGISGDDIVGYYTDTNANVHGFLYSRGVYTTLNEPNTIGGTYAQGIDGGKIVGSYWGSDSAYHGFIYSNGGYTTLDNPNAYSSTFASGIFDGNIVGWYYDRSGIPHGFLYDGSSFTTLDDPDAVSGTYACGISGDSIVGYYFGQGGSVHGFLYSQGAYSTLDVPGAGIGTFQGTYLRGVSGNTVVGWYSNDDGSYGFTATVSLIPSNQISIKGISVSGANVTLNGINGVSGTTNYVLMSANLALPFNEWMSVATNLLSVNGNFTITVTNTVNRATRQQFYILQSQ